MLKTLTANAGDIRDSGSVSESGRFPGGGYGNPLHYFCLENSMDRGAWQATVHGVANSRTCLSTHTHTHTRTHTQILGLLKTLSLDKDTDTLGVRASTYKL